MKKSFGGFIDLGLIDSKGIQRSYAGPYELLGKNYADQDWFNEAKLRDVYISEVFMGFRKFPHFVIAVKEENKSGDFYILRATFDIELIRRQLKALHLMPASDAFFISQGGIIQTGSHSYGKILELCTINVPRSSPHGEVIEITDNNGKRRILGYAYIENSPFIFMVVQRPEELMKSWFTLRNELFIFLLISISLIILFVLGGSTYMVNGLQEADHKRTQILHNLEYTNKLAAIGRLAAGVAHEVNNPLAIIDQKAGLLKDIISAGKEHPYHAKFLGIANSILESVERCSSITHRLLGFAKRMDLKTEPINLEILINEVLGFLGKEAEVRNIFIDLKVGEGIPDIQSDRGQLQQVFLNIINNAFAASDDGGKIGITIEESDEGTTSVTITDNGTGIAEERLKRIFEPFYTTKKEGTGLGLSITYGIIKNLGGNISVESKVGEGTSFIVSLPQKQ